MKIMRPSLPRQKETSCVACPIRGKSLFCSLSRSLVKKLEASKSTNAYKKGQMLFYEGSPALGVHCIFSGKVKLYKSGRMGHQQIENIAEAGELLGYREIFSDEPYSRTAEVMEDVLVCFVDKNAFQELLRDNFDLAFRLMRELSREVKSFEERLLDLVDKPAHVRLAQLLLSLKESYGRGKGNGLGITLTRHELAEMINTTVETAIRILSQFKKRGAIHIDGQNIEIVDRNILLRIALLPVPNHVVGD